MSKMNNFSTIINQMNKMIKEVKYGSGTENITTFSGKINLPNLEKNKFLRVDKNNNLSTVNISSSDNIDVIQGIDSENIYISLKEILNGNFTIAGNLIVNNIIIKGLIIEESVAYINNNFPNMIPYLTKNTIVINDLYSFGFENYPQNTSFRCLLPNGTGTIGQKIKIINNSNLMGVVIANDGKIYRQIHISYYDMNNILELCYDGSKWIFLTQNINTTYPNNYVYNYDEDEYKKIPTKDDANNNYNIIKIIGKNEKDIDLTINDQNNEDNIILFNGTNNKITITNIISPEQKNIMNVFGDILYCSFFNTKWYYGFTHIIKNKYESIAKYIDVDYNIIKYEYEYNYTGILINTYGIEDKKIYFVNNHFLDIKIFIDDGKKYVILSPNTIAYFEYINNKIWTFENPLMEIESKMYEFNDNENNIVSVKNGEKYDIIKINTTLQTIKLDDGEDGQFIYLYNAKDDNIIIDNIIFLVEYSTFRFGYIISATFISGQWYEGHAEYINKVFINFTDKLDLNYIIIDNDQNVSSVGLLPNNISDHQKKINIVNKCQKDLKIFHDDGRKLTTITNNNLQSFDYLDGKWNSNTSVDQLMYEYNGSIQNISACDIIKINTSIMIGQLMFEMANKINDGQILYLFNNTDNIINIATMGIISSNPDIERSIKKNDIICVTLLNRIWNI